MAITTSSSTSVNAQVIATTEVRRDASVHVDTLHTDWCDSEQPCVHSGPRRGCFHGELVMNRSAHHAEVPRCNTPWQTGAN